MSGSTAAGHHSDPTPRSGQASDRLTVGWREWVALPELSVPAIKVKIDTGARTSALHALDVRTERRDGVEVALFDVAPLRDHSRFVISCVSPIVDERIVRSSNGQETLRLFIRSRLEVGDHAWSIQLSLYDRSDMRFPMLLGRRAMRRHLTVDPAASYLTGRRRPHIYRELALPRKRTP